MVLFLIFAVILGIIALAVRFRTERRDSVDYLALAKEIADDEAAIAAGLADLFATLGELERPDILERVDGLSSESAAMQRRLDEVTVTAAVGEANGYFVVATGSWNRALSALEEAILEILDGDDEGRAGESILKAAFSDLRVGDRSYEGFREAVERIDPDLVTRDYPEFGFTAGDRDILYDAAVVANHLRTTLRFEENRDVSIRATTDPEPLGSENGVRVVPDSETFSVQAVITNEGNVSAELITVSLRLTAAGGDSDERSEIVPSLQPGEATTVLFADFALVPSVAYELQVSAEVADDDVPDNNTWEMIFVRNEP